MMPYVVASMVSRHTGPEEVEREGRSDEERDIQEYRAYLRKLRGTEGTSEERHSNIVRVGGGGGSHCCLASFRSRLKITAWASGTGARAWGSVGRRGKAADTGALMTMGAAGGGGPAEAEAEEAAA